MNISWQQVLLRFINRLKYNKKSSHTIAAYRNDISLFIHFLATTGFKPDDFGSDIGAQWQHFLSVQGRRSEASVRRAQMSVRSFLRYLVEEKMIEGSPLIESKSPRQPKHSLCVISETHFQSLAKQLKARALRGDEKSIRDWALVLILGELGLKASEVCALSWGDVVWDEKSKQGGIITVRGTAERILTFSKSTSISLTLLKNLRRSLGLGVTYQDKLFFGYLNITRRTRTPDIQRHGVKFIIYEVCNEFLNSPYHAESLRGRAVLSWIEKGYTSEKIAEFAGYSSIHSLDRFVNSREAKEL